MGECAACRRRPGHRPCPGLIAVLRTEIPPSVEWRCVSCGDEGAISGWERSPFDLRPGSTDDASGEAVRAVIPPDIAATLRSLMLIDSACERMIFRATVADGGIVLAGDVDDLDEVLGYVMAEANREDDRRRQKRLDTAFNVLSEVVEQAQP